MSTQKFYDLQKNVKFIDFYIEILYNAIIIGGLKGGKTVGIFRGRYLVLALCFFISAVALTMELGARALLFYLLALILLFSVLLLLFRKKSKNLLCVLLICLSLASLGGLRAHIRIENNERIVDTYCGEGEIFGYVSEVNYRSSYYSEYKIRIENVNGRDEGFYAVFTTDHDSELSRGDFISAKVIMSKHGQLEYYNDADCILECELQKTESVVSREKEFRHSLLLASWRSKLSAILVNGIDGENGKVASALVLGERELVSGETMRDFRRTGLVHLLSLSGTHISIIIGLFELLLRKLYVPKWIRCIISSCLALFYIALTGFLPSACRAMFMLWFVYMAYCFGKSSDSLTSLFLAVSLIIAVSPSSVSDIGLILSFLATFGIIVAFMLVPKLGFMTSKINGGRVKRFCVGSARRMLTLLISSVFVFVLTLPVIYMTFGEVSAVTFFTNIFMGIFCEIFMSCCILMLLVSPVSWLCGIFAFLAELFGSIMLSIVSFVSDFRYIVLSLKYDFAGVMIWMLFASVLFFLIIRIKRVHLIFLPMLIFAVFFSAGIVSHELSKRDALMGTFVSESEGEAIVLCFENEVYIADFSGGDHSPLNDALMIAKDRCYTEIDGIILSHYHTDHQRTLAKLCSKNIVRRIYLPKPRDESEFFVFSAIRRQFSSTGTEVLLYSPENEIDIGGGALRISRAYGDGKSEHPVQAMSISFGEDLMVYAENGFLSESIKSDPYWTDAIGGCDTLIEGTHGPSASNEIDLEKLSEAEIYSFAKKYEIFGGLYRLNFIMDGK